MTSHDILPDQPAPIDHQQSLQTLFATLTEITTRFTPQIDGGVFGLDDEQQQALIDQINPYIRFELANHPELHDLPVRASGGGMMLLSDLEGGILGAEQISFTDEVTGRIADICALPTPTVECLVASNGEEIPSTDQVLSPVLILRQGIFKTNYSEAHGFETEHDLSIYQTCLPLAHYLKITAEAPASA